MKFFSIPALLTTLLVADVALASMYKPPTVRQGGRVQVEETRGQKIARLQKEIEELDVLDSFYVSLLINGNWDLNDGKELDHEGKKVDINMAQEKGAVISGRLTRARQALNEALGQ